MRALLTMGLALVLAAAAGRAESLGENLVRDGGMETWTAIGPSSPWWDHLAVGHKAWTFAKDGKGDLLTPGILSQLYEGSGHEARVGGCPRRRQGSAFERAVLPQREPP